MLFAAAVEDARLKDAHAVDDPRQTADAGVKEGTEPCQQEHRRNRKLDDLGQVAKVRSVRQDGALVHVPLVR